jgi:oxygen-independent coproporphyrinogen-3 oxidase
MLADTASPRTQRPASGTKNVAVTANIGTIRDESDGLALYVHWPFCVSKCPYCDFNSHVRASIDQEVWRDALLADLAHEAQLLPGRELTSIFFGGGTPSLMDPGTVEALQTE